MQFPITCSVQIKRLSHAAGMDLPGYTTEGSAGMDLMAAIPADDPWLIGPGERKLIPTGLAIAVPVGFEAQIRPRSGLALKKGLSVPNAPGTIDSDYRGEVQVIMINHGQSDVVIERGMRIAQMVFAPVAQATWQEVDDLDTTTRGAGGFGSTGS